MSPVSENNGLGSDSVEVTLAETVINKEAEESSHEALTQPETRMTKAKWLACIALCVSYTTAYQQSACTAAIVKHIDSQLGETAVVYVAV